MTVGCGICHKTQNAMQNITMLHIQKSDVTPSLLYTADTLCFIILTILMVCEECRFENVQLVQSSLTFRQFHSNCLSQVLKKMAIYSKNIYSSHLLATTYQTTLHKNKEHCIIIIIIIIIIINYTEQSLF